MVDETEPKIPKPYSAETEKIVGTIGGLAKAIASKEDTSPTQDTVIKEKKKEHIAVAINNKAKNVHALFANFFTHLIGPSFKLIFKLSMFCLIIYLLLTVFKNPAYAMAEEYAGQEVLINSQGKVDYGKVAQVLIKQNKENWDKKLLKISEGLTSRVEGTYTPTETTDTTEYGLKLTAFGPSKVYGNDPIDIEIFVIPKMLGRDMLGIGHSVENQEAIIFCEYEDQEGELIEVEYKYSMFVMQNDFTLVAGCTLPHTISNKPTDRVIARLEYPFNSYSTLQVSALKPEDHDDLYTSINTKLLIRDEDDLQAHFVSETGIDHRLYAISKNTPIRTKAEISGVQPLKVGYDNYHLFVTIENSGDGVAYLTDIIIEAPAGITVDNNYIKSRIDRGIMIQRLEAVKEGYRHKVYNGYKIDTENEIFSIPITTDGNLASSDNYITTSRINIYAKYLYVTEKLVLVHLQTCDDYLDIDPDLLNRLPPEDKQEILDSIPEECSEYIDLTTGEVKRDYSDSPEDEKYGTYGEDAEAESTDEQAAQTETEEETNYVDSPEAENYGSNTGGVV